jgi:hypothetical protein
MNSLAILRQLFFAWAFAALLPLPVLLATNPASDSDIKCLYLGVAAAWFATEVFRPNGAPMSPELWRDKMLALLIAVAINVSLFILLGLSTGVQSNIPFPLKAAFSAVPALGVMPWLSQRVKQQYVAIFLGVTMITAAKLLGCIVARLVYGPNYLEEGYASGDWRTAKLMISLFWAFTISLSAGLLWQSYRVAQRAEGNRERTGENA